MKTAIITGASDGIGKEAARKLLQSGWQVALIGRNRQKTLEAAAQLGAKPYVADFASLSQVRDLAMQLLVDTPDIHLLVNNAGGIFSKQPFTEDGFEITFQVNHLAHFLLTNLLMPRLLASRGVIINTSSVAHKSIGRFFDVQDVAKPRHFNQHLAYGNAKLANLLFTYELNQRYGSAGIAAVAFHPGIVATSFARDSHSPMRLVYHGFLRGILKMIPPGEGADTLVWLAESQPNKDWQPGGYYVRRKLAATIKKAQNPALAASLWDLSADWVKPFLNIR